MDKNINPKIEIEEQVDSPPEVHLVNQFGNQDIPIINIVVNPNQVPNVNAVNVQVPLFIKKIWKIINDPSTDDIISWTDCGQGFIVHDQLRFISETLPKYFKHNQMSSFVRQLNLYDFHKVQNVEREECNFSHPFFQKDLPELLPLIKRKSQPVRSKAAPAQPPNTQPQQNEQQQTQQQQQQQSEVLRLVNTLNEIKSKSENISAEMTKLRQENAALWREMNSLRLKYSKQTKIINKLIHFLIAYVQKHHSARNSRGGRTVSTSNSNKYLKTGPKIMELDYRYRNNPREFWSEFDNNADEVDNYTVVEPADNFSDNEGLKTRQKPLPNMQVSSAIEEILPGASQNLQGAQSAKNLSEYNHTKSIPSTSKRPSNNALQRTTSQESLGYLIDNSRAERNQIKELLMNLTPEDMTNFYKLVNDNYKLQEDELLLDVEEGLETVKEAANLDSSEADLDNVINNKEPTNLGSTQVDLDQIINNKESPSLDSAQLDLDNLINNGSGSFDSQLTEAVLNDIIRGQNEQSAEAINESASANMNQPSNEESTSFGLGTDDLLNADDDLLNNVSVDQYFIID